MPDGGFLSKRTTITSQVNVLATGADPSSIQGRTLTNFDDVATYISKTGKVPSNFVTKQDADALGWKPKLGNLDVVAPCKSISGDIFKNNEGKLPNANGKTRFEADMSYYSGFRGSDRLLYSNDGLIYKTTDHYKNFTQIK